VFKWLFNLFKKKEKRLVAIITGHISYQETEYGSWEHNGGRITYYLYERSDGKRYIKYVRNVDSLRRLYRTNQERTQHWNVLMSWKKNAYSSSNIPTYLMMSDLAKPLVLELPANGYLPLL
jgi:hypothetical protein